MADQQVLPQPVQHIDVYKRQVVCHENEIRKKYKVEEIGNQKAVAAMQQLFSITAKMRSRQHGKMDGSS